MPSIYNQADIDSFIERINKLTPASAREWGKMNVAQMLEHCRLPLLVVTGELKAKRSILGYIFGRFALNQGLQQQQIKRGLPTSPEFKVVDSGDFEKQKQQLIMMLQRFGKSGATLVSTQPHPFFGVMSAEEVDNIQWKHIDHHLRQFGV